MRKNIWFTSDPHFGHKNISSPNESNWDKGYRNFSSLNEMNENIVNNINIVKEDDILYILGDFSFGGIDNILLFRNQIRCKNIHLILGNHDHNIKNKYFKTKDGILFNPIELFTTINQVYNGKIGDKYFHLSHYAHLVWPESHKGSIHLFGHSHGTVVGVGKSMDVGFDSHPEFRPFNFDEIIELMKNK